MTRRKNRLLFSITGINNQGHSTPLSKIIINFTILAYRTIVNKIGNATKWNHPLISKAIKLLA